MDLPLEGSICPITRSLMEDPVIAFDGYSYERVAIESFFQTARQQGKIVSPITAAQLPSDVVIPNIALKQAIQGWRNRQLQGFSGNTESPKAGGSGMYPSASSSSSAQHVCGGFVVGIPQMQHQATTYYPVTQLSYNIVTGQVMAPSEKNAAMWKWNETKKGPAISLSEHGALATRGEEGASLDREKLIVVCHRPVRLYSNETQEFHVKVVSTSTAWAGLQIGVVPDYPELADESMIDQCIDTRGYLIDGERWMRTPGMDGNQLTSFNSAELRENDVVSVVLSDSGGFFILTNGKVQAKIPDMQIPCKISDPPLYPFVILTGNCNACRIGVPRPTEFDLPPECKLSTVDPSVVNIPMDAGAVKQA